MRATGRGPSTRFEPAAVTTRARSLGQSPTFVGARIDEEERVTMIRGFRREMVLAVGAAVIVGACSSGGGGAPSFWFVGLLGLLAAVRRLLARAA